MNVKTLVSKSLKSQGIVASKSELGLNFAFQDWNFLLLDDKEDPSLFRLTLPGIYDVTDANFARAIMACNNVNWKYKVVKAVLYEFEDEHDKGTSVWMCYEQELDANPQVEELIPRAVHSLIAAAEAFNKEMVEE